jgi:glutaredoxin
MFAVIIFSKSYCPHSKRAKNILLEKYIIDPAPYVVELDKHELGPQLQAKLTDLTGRRTVPNVLIQAVSIGGGDDVAELDLKKTLIGKVKELGGKRILDVRERPAEKKEQDPEPETKPEPHGLR